jgi:hypothetical protein
VNSNKKENWYRLITSSKKLFASLKSTLSVIYYLWLRFSFGYKWCCYSLYRKQI